MPNATTGSAGGASVSEEEAIRERVRQLMSRLLPGPKTCWTQYFSTRRRVCAPAPWRGRWTAGQLLDNLVCRD
jgi:hypothetical protein